MDDEYFDYASLTNSGSTARTYHGFAPFQPSLVQQDSEEVQILLLGAPGTGKTRLQSRYILRQFVDIVDGNAHRMGGHKYLMMLDGVKVHLIIQEVSMGSPIHGSPTTESERCSRKRLLEKSDAVMLLFNPWSKESFEWIDESLIDDILDAGNKKRLMKDIVGLLNDEKSFNVPKRTMTQRSAKLLEARQNQLPERPKSSGSLFRLNGRDKQEQVAADKHDSGISMQSVSSTSSRYSESTLAVDSQPQTFPKFEDLKKTTKVEHSKLDPSTRELAEDSEIPVIVVATMTDRLKDNGGTKERVVAREQGQQVARCFGKDCGYIEVSARSNVNVDHAYGIIVDHVMSKRRRQHRHSMIPARFEEELMTAGPGPEQIVAERRASLPTSQRRSSRSCMPDLSSVMAAIGRAFSPDPDEAYDGEDRWGYELPRRQRREQMYRYQTNNQTEITHPLSINNRPPLQTFHSDKLSSRTMSHGPERSGPLVINSDTWGRGALTKSAPPALPPVRRGEQYRSQSVATVSVYEPERYSTVLKIMNPDTHEVEKPQYAALSRKRHKPDLTIAVGKDVRKSDWSQLEPLPLLPPPPAAATASNRNARPDAPRDPPLSYDRAVSMHADVNGAPVIPPKSQQRRGSQRMSQPVRRLGSLRTTTSTAPPSPSQQRKRGSGSDSSASTTSERSNDRQRRVSSVSVVFRPASHQPTVGNGQESFVLVLSPTETKKAKDAAADDDHASLRLQSRTTATDHDNQTATALVEEEAAQARAIPAPTQTKGEDAKKKRRKLTVEDVLFSSTMSSQAPALASAPRAADNENPRDPAQVPSPPAVPTVSYTAITSPPRNAMPTVPPTVARTINYVKKSYASTTAATVTTTQPTAATNTTTLNTSHPGVTEFRFPPEQQQQQQPKSVDGGGRSTTLQKMLPITSTSTSTSTSSEQEQEQEQSFLRIPTATVPTPGDVSRATSTKSMLSILEYYVDGNNNTATIAEEEIPNQPETAAATTAAAMAAMVAVQATRPLPPLPTKATTGTGSPWMSTQQQRGRQMVV